MIRGRTANAKLGINSRSKTGFALAINARIERLEAGHRDWHVKVFERMITDQKIAEEVQDLDYVQINQLVTILGFGGTVELSKNARKLHSLEGDDRLAGLDPLLTRYGRDEIDVRRALDMVFERVAQEGQEVGQDPPGPQEAAGAGRPFEWFFSYNSAEKRDDQGRDLVSNPVDDLRSILEMGLGCKEMRVVMDSSSLDVGEDWEDKLRKMPEFCAGMLVFVGARGEGPTQRDLEMNEIAPGFLSKGKKVVFILGHHCPADYQPSNQSLCKLHMLDLKRIPYGDLIQEVYDKTWM